jgi:small subunit ribosomal protein S16
VAQLFKSIGTQERFERFKAGESVETLLAEAESVRASRQPTPRTGK